jgi:hypothetical protein
MRGSWIAVPLLCLFAAAPGTSGADVTIDVEDVGLEYVIDALEEQSGFTIHCAGRGMPVGVTLRAENEPLKKVLRKVCNQAGVHYETLGGSGFIIRDGPFPESPYKAELATMRLHVQALEIRGKQRNVNLTGGQPVRSGSRPPGLIRLHVDAYLDELLRVCDVEDLSVVDAEGNRLDMPNAEQAARNMVRSMTFGRLVRYGIATPAIPCALHGAQGGAVTLSGTLVSYRKAEPVDFRFDDLKTQGQVVRQGDRSVTLRQVRVLNNVVQVNMKLDGFARPAERLKQHEDPPEVSWEMDQLVVEYADGTEHVVKGPHYYGGPTGVGHNPRKEPAAVIYRAWKRSDPTRRQKFEIKDIPLPARE